MVELSRHSQLDFSFLVFTNLDEWHNNQTAKSKTDLTGVIAGQNPPPVPVTMILVGVFIGSWTQDPCHLDDALMGTTLQPYTDKRQGH